MSSDPALILTELAVSRGSCDAVAVHAHAVALVRAAAGVPRLHEAAAALVAVTAGENWQDWDAVDDRIGAVALALQHPGSAERMRVVVGDITTLAVDAIVNAANSALQRGGGVDGAIHRAAGPELQAACNALGGCPTGEARTTSGFKLPARWVIHAVGPRWRDGRHDEDALLAGAYRSALREATRLGARSVAFPAISTGIYGFPLERATEVAVRTTADHLAREVLPAAVIFCCFAPDVAAVYERALSTGSP
jgi:O-acetyl-ADP-ribose deacetylase (regulator of RNase III)